MDFPIVRNGLMPSNMIKFTVISMLFMGCVYTPVVLHAQGRNFAAPPQESGLAYTRSAQEVALKALSQTISICAGGRYAWVYGQKVRLDTADLLRSEAFMKDGHFFVPEAFASILAMDRLQTEPIPPGLEVLKSRWVYEVPRKYIPISKEISSIQLRGTRWVDALELAKSLGKNARLTSRGLLLVSKDPIRYLEGDKKLDDAIISLFDTPEKYIDPDMAMEYIPLLKAQGKWTQHARFDATSLWAIEHGEEETWPHVAKDAYDFTGFNFALLGSPLPKPGEYPRLLFSPQDIPTLQAHIRQHTLAQKSLIEIEVLLKKSWLDSSTSDGKVFLDLEHNRIPKHAVVTQSGGLYAIGKWTPEHQPVIYNTHINYITNCLTTLALYCLLTGNESLGKRTADAIYHYYRLLDSKVEEHLLTSDSEFGTNDQMANQSSTQWRGMHSIVAHMDIAFSLDFAGRYMRDDQRLFMQQLIAKATYGRRTNGGDGPLRAWRDINHVTWHLTHLLALSTIEGLPGFDSEAYASASGLVRDFLDFGIDSAGQIFETNGKNGGGLQFQFLAMIAEARRGNNRFGHPHLRKLLRAQALMTSPNNRETNSGGTWGGGPLSIQCLMMLKSFFPKEKEADYLIQQHFSTPASWGPNVVKIPEDPTVLDVESYRAKLEKNIRGLRLPGLNYPGFVLPFPYVTDWKKTTREALELPLDWNTDQHGMFATSSDRTANATWLSMNIRSNHYIGSGHHHNDIGMFYFSSLGVNWITESPFQKTYGGIYHNEVLIDGKSQGLIDAPTAKGHYLGANLFTDASFATIDQTNAYTWQWCTQVSEWGKGFSRIDSTVAVRGWELETDPEVLKYFIGTSRYKMRIWWPTSNYANFIPTLKALYNPVKFVYRTAGLIKGLHPIAVVVDDLQKDEASHVYEWTAMLGKGVWQVNVPDAPPQAMMLGYQSSLEKTWLAPLQLEAWVPKPGDPLLLVFPLGMEGDQALKVEVAKDGPDEGKGPQSYNRLVITRRSTKVNFRILLIPMRYGEVLPKIDYQNERATLRWKDGHETTIGFTTQADGRTLTQILKHGKVVAKSR
jgi:hypothetical protein